MSGKSSEIYRRRSETKRRTRFIPEVASAAVWTLSRFNEGGPQELRLKWLLDDSDVFLSTSYTELAVYIVEGQDLDLTVHKLIDIEGKLQQPLGPEYRRVARGPRLHLKRLAAPKSWMLDKLSGTYAPRPASGPHKLRESFPLIVFLRNRLKYALNGREVKEITRQRLIKVDNKVRTEINYPTGFMDVVSIEKSNEHFRIIYDVKGRFTIHRITAEEAKYKLLKVKRVALGNRGIPHIVTHDGRTIRYPDPLIRANDTVKFDLENNKLGDFIKFDVGTTCMVTGGRNIGRVGTIVRREKHLGGHDIIHVKDANDREFATRIGNIFVIGDHEKPWISLPKAKGIKLTIAEERDARRKTVDES
ncbi:40S ribosomal protein S4 [Tulasnella sp. 403]|nr:40S ribosomal protein S4 [Tulasnella sp. 403]